VLGRDRGLAANRSSRPGPAGRRAASSASWSASPARFWRLASSWPPPIRRTSAGIHQLRIALWSEPSCCSRFAAPVPERGSPAGSARSGRAWCPIVCSRERHAEPAGPVAPLSSAPQTAATCTPERAGADRPASPIGALVAGGSPDRRRRLPGPLARPVGGSGRDPGRVERPTADIAGPCREARWPTS